MNRRTAAWAVALFLGAMFVRAQSQSGTAETPSLETGRKLFTARCSSCHNDRGDKPLDKGLPLNQRPLSDAVIVKNIEMRFGKASESDRRAVVAYVRSFMKQPAK